jgi:4-diphosphocytidyl-2-C-methyl-D-erythritol kinase
LGADVPFFLGGHNAWVEGIGDIMAPITLPPGNFLVAKPAAGLPTQAIFSDPALKRDSDTAILSGFSASPFGFGRNDLQRVAQRLCPGVTQALDWLVSLGLSGRMTGSGSAVFAHLDQPLQVESVPASIQTRVCSNLGVHPLAGWASA